jgi:hypothetical protein
MRFRNFDFKKVLAGRDNIMSPRICLALAALFMCLCPLTANAQASRIKGYAVQVAALSSQRSAERLAQGLSARGVPAYCVGGVSYGAASIHRVRVGNFLTILSANTYAEKLLGSGLLGSYAIAAYEPPSKAGSISNGNVQTLAQKQSGKRFMPEVIDVIAAIGSRGWLLLSSESIKLTAREGNSELSRELDKLTVVLNSRGWSLNNNIAKILASPAPVNIAPLSNEIIANAPPPSRASSNPSNAPAFGVAREDLIPGSSTSIGSPISRSRIFDSGPRLQGSIEMRGGRMFMTLRNIDPERGFSGVARISLSDDSKQQDVTPIQFTLPPDREASFPVNEATLTDGAWILMVYDQNGAARLIRGDSLAPRKAPAQAPTNSTASADTNSAQQTPPSYVTGIYDTTTWTQPQAPPQVQNIESQDSVVSEAANVQNGASDLGVAGSPTQAPQVETGPGQVAAALRQIAITRENVTLELVLSASDAIKNVTVTLRAGDFQDVRQTFIPTSQGSVPFLVPVGFASVGIFYEVKDEAQRVLASGTSDLRSLGR